MRKILVVRLGAMGDILHAIPAAVSLRAAGDVRISWLVKPQFRELLVGGAADEILEFRRTSPRHLFKAIRTLRSRRFDGAVDFQGLLQSAVLASMSGARRVWGFARHLLREPAAALFYDERVRTEAAHVVDRNLDLALAAGAAARILSFPLPEGRPEGTLPEHPFVLASPFAGWGAKQWPLEYYFQLAGMIERELGLPLVLNASPAQAAALAQRGAQVHVSTISGLIHATRRAAAVIGVDSGPLHLAAALDRPGVAIYGPTDPARNGPCSARIRVLRSAGARTSYRRTPEPDESMIAVTPSQVFEALREVL